MSLLGVKEYVRATLQNADVSIRANTSYTNLELFRQVPKFEKLGSGLFIVMVDFRRREKRLTVPRLQGGKTLEYRLRLALVAVAKDEQTGGDDFDTAFENLSQALRVVGGAVTSANPTATDPKTGAVSTVLSVAEEMDDTGSEPTVGERQGLMRFFAEKEVLITEYIVG